MTLKATITSQTGTVSLSSSAYANPVTVTGTIDNTADNPFGGALYASAAWSVVNQGTVEVTGTGTGSGVDLTGGGSFDNAAGALVAGYKGGVYLTGSAAPTLVNAGTITTGGGLFGGLGVSLSSSAGGSLQNSGSIYGGVLIAGGAGTVTDTGGTLTGGGIDLHKGGYASIATGAVIQTGGFGVAIEYASGSVTNAGSINGGRGGIELALGGSVQNSGQLVATNALGMGVYLKAGGTFTNLAGGLAYGALGVYAKTAATVINAGAIGTNQDFGVSLNAGGVVNNQAGGTIASPLNVTAIPVEFSNGAGTLLNAGSISVAFAGLYSVRFAAGFANRLVAYPGAHFDHIVDGGNTIGAGATSVIELAAGSGTGTLENIGSSINGGSFTNFGSIAFDTSARWLISGSPAGLADGQTISGFVAGDTIQLTGVHETIASFDGNNLTLGGDATLTLIVPGMNSAFSAALDGGATDISLACFAAGTRILTDAGEVPVEDLQSAARAGMRVVSLTHQRALPVRWVGRQRSRVAPVRVAAGAFGAGMPHRDLLLSPDHAVWIREKMVPVRHLVNGASIAEAPCGEVEYFHVELEAHGVLLAEGLPAESFLDTGNRFAFAANAARRAPAA